MILVELFWWKLNIPYMSSLLPPCLLSLFSCLLERSSFLCLTEQIPDVVFLQTTARKKRQKIKVLGVKYQIVRIKEEKFFGIRKAWIENVRVNITDKEKTIVDCPDKPQYCGGIVEVGKTLKDNNDEGKMVEY